MLPRATRVWATLLGALTLQVSMLSAQTAAPLAQEFSAQPARQVTTATGSPLRLRFRPKAANWTARVHFCERPADASFSEDPGCGMLVMASGAERRYLLIDPDLAVNKPQLSAVRLPDGQKALLLVEARGFEQHTDTWVAHLIEEGDDGPRVALQVVIDVCSWGDDGAKCTPVRPSARAFDADQDGDLDLELSFQGGNGMKQRDLFVRQANGRFLLPARYLDPQTFIPQTHKDFAPAQHADAPSQPPAACPVTVQAPRAPLKLHAQRDGRGPVVGTLAHESAVGVAEVRGAWSRLNVPQAGWVPSASLKRCVR